MAWTGISNTVPQYEENGIAASGFYIKFYASGTVTPIPMAIDSTGATTLAKCVLSTEGYPLNGSSAVFIPHIDQLYKIILYRNATDADADTTANAVWIVDSLSPVLNNETTFDSLTNFVLEEAVLNDVVISTALVDGQAFDVKERTDGNKGGGLWDVVLTSTVTPNTFNIVLCTGIPTLSLVLRIDKFVDPAQLGASSVGSSHTQFAHAWTLGKTLKPSPGTYNFSASVTIPDQGQIVSDTYKYGEVRLMADSGVDIFLVSPSAISFFNTIKGITFGANAGTTSVGIKGSAEYTSVLWIEGNHFDVSLNKAIEGNFINMTSRNNNIGYFGSPTNMTVGYEITGVAGVREANHNQFWNDRFININGDGVKITEGWNASFHGCDFEVLNGHATNIAGGFGVNYYACWTEKCGNLSTADGIFKFTSGTSGIFVVNFFGGLNQVNVANNTQVFDEGGSLIINLHGVTFGGLASGSFALGNGLTKFRLSNDSYYPGGFSDFSVPRIVRDGATEYTTFNEISSAASGFAKTLKNDNASNTGTIQGLESTRAASGAYNFLIGRSDVDGTPVVQHQLTGNGKGLHKGGIGVGNSAAATTPGSVTKKVEIFDMAGASLGFIAVYGSIS